MTTDIATATAVSAHRQTRSFIDGWSWIVGLMTAVILSAAAYAVGVVLPYQVNDGRRAPSPDDVAAGVEGAEPLWPQNTWTGTLDWLGYLAVELGPLAASLAVVLGSCGLALLSRRPVPHKAGRVVCLVVLLAGSAAALLFVAGDTGQAMSNWRID